MENKGPLFSNNQALFFNTRYLFQNTPRVIKITLKDFIENQANSSIMSALIPNLECRRLAIGIVIRLFPLSI